MGDELLTTGCVVFPDGSLAPLAGITGVRLGPGAFSPEPGVPLSGKFSVPVELDNLGVLDAMARGLGGCRASVEIRKNATRRLAGPSRFMRSRRMWQCRRGRRNANVERRKLARKRSHLVSESHTVVFPSVRMTEDFERNEVVFDFRDGDTG